MKTCGFVFPNQRSRVAGFFAKDTTTLNELFMHQLQGFYYAGTQLVEALPKMAGKVAEKQHKQGLLSHPDQTGMRPIAPAGGIQGGRKLIVR